MIKINKLDEYLVEYMDDKDQVKDLSEITIKHQSFNIRRFISYLEREGIEELNNENIKDLLGDYRRWCITKQKNKRTTVQRYIMHILGFLNSDKVQRAIKHEPINIKDIISMKAEDPQTAKMRIEKISLTRKQSAFFLDTIKQSGKDRDYAICRVLIESGLRLKELALLNKTDIKNPIDERGFYVLPEDTKSLIKVMLRPETTKGGIKARMTFITYKTLESLNDMIRGRITKLRKNKNGNYSYITQRKKAKEERTREELFITNRNKRIGKDAVQKLVKKHARGCDERIKRENIDCPIKYSKSVSVHILRHTALSHYAEILPIAGVQAIAGHSSSQTTDKYMNVDNNWVEEMLRKNLMRR